MCHILTTAFDLAVKNVDGITSGEIFHRLHSWESSFIEIKSAHISEEISMEVERLRFQLILRDNVMQHGSGLVTTLVIMRMDYLEDNTQVYYRVDIGY